MTAKSTTKISTAQRHPQPNTQETTKQWFSRHLLKPVPWQKEGAREKVGASRHSSLKRPRTAPSAAPATLEVPPPLPIEVERLSAFSIAKAPPRPPRPNSGVIRDVNAWLDTSLNKQALPASPLMGGISYWREGTFTNIGEPTDVQYAIAIVHEPDSERPTIFHSQQLKSFCHRAKRMPVRMPSLRRMRSQRVTVQKKANRRSASTPLLAIPYEEAEVGTAPAFLTRLRSVSRPSTAAASTQTGQIGGWCGAGLGLSLDLPLRGDNLASTRYGELEYSMEPRINAVFGHTSRIGDTLRPMPAAANIPREDSMAGLSDAPTYFTGPAPPSYRSRAASIVTTSSFGCIDGMKSEQRQLSRQRAAQKNHGMKGRLRKFAQRAHLTK